MTIGMQIRFLRRKRFLKQDKLAEKLGCSVSSIRRWENDDGGPNWDLLLKLSTFFGMSLSEFLNGVTQ